MEQELHWPPEMRCYCVQGSSEGSVQTRTVQCSADGRNCVVLRKCIVIEHKNVLKEVYIFTLFNVARMVPELGHASERIVLRNCIVLWKNVVTVHKEILKEVYIIILCSM